MRESHAAAELVTRRGQPASGDRAVGLLGFLLLTVAFLMSWDTALQSNGMDFYQYWAVDRALAGESIRDIYTAEARQRIAGRFLAEAAAGQGGDRFRSVATQRAEFETYQSPFLYFVFQPLAAMPFERAYLIYQLIAIGAGLAAITVWATTVGFSWSTGMLAAAAWSIGCEPFVSDVRVGNVNRLLLALTALCLVIRSGRSGATRDVLCGAGLGVGLLFKPIFAYGVLLIMIQRVARREWHAAARELAGFAVACSVGIVFGGGYLGSLSSWGSWVQALRWQPDDIVGVRQGNFAPAMLILDSLGLRLTAILPWIVFPPVAIVVWRQARRVGGRESQSPAILDARALALGLLVYLLSSRLVWLHYLLLAIPAWLIAARSFESGRPAAIRILLAVVVSGAWLVISVQPLRSALNVTSAYAHGWLIAAALLALLAVVLMNRPARPPHSPGQSPTI